MRNFEVMYSEDCLKNCLLLNIPQNSTIYNYQLQMVMHNFCYGLLRFEFINNCIHYDTTSKISLSNYLKNNLLTKQDFILILEDMAKIILNSHGYFLNEKNFLLAKDFIYLNPLNKKIYLVYLPFEFENTFVEDFKTLLSNLIESVEIQDNDNFKIELKSYIESSNFNIRELIFLVKNLNSMQCVQSFINQNLNSQASTKLGMFHFVKKMFSYNIQPKYSVLNKDFIEIPRKVAK